MSDNELRRVFIADIQQDPKNSNYKSIAFLFANDLEKQEDTVTLTNHTSGNYIVLHDKTLAGFLEASNMDGDYPVFNVKLHGDLLDKGVAVPNLNSLQKPDEPFNLKKHIENTPKSVTLVNNRLGTKVPFGMPESIKTKTKEHALEL